MVAPMPNASVRNRDDGEAWLVPHLRRSVASVRINAVIVLSSPSTESTATFVATSGFATGEPSSVLLETLSLKAARNSPTMLNLL